MRRSFFLLLGLAACTASGKPEAGEEVAGAPTCHREVGPDAMLLPYDAFGPQAMAFGLIGLGWWQWDGEGHEFVEQDGEVWVVVHDDLSEEELARRFPVSEARRCDNRYVTRREAMEYFDTNIEELAELSTDPDLGDFEQLAESLRATQRRIARQGWGHAPRAAQ